MSKNFNQSRKLCEDNDCVYTKWKQHTHRRHSDGCKIHPDILDTVGYTPMVKLNKIPQAAGIKCDVYGKVEFFNPGGSVKDRIAIRMIEDAEEQGRLKPGCTIIEPTSGNTGIGLAMACAVKGYRCIIVMPEKISNEKYDIHAALGVEIVLTPKNARNSPEGPILVAERLSKEIPNSIILDQYSNPGNPLAHYDCTGEEILEQCNGQVDMLVIGAGTGGSINGISQKVKEKIPNCKTIGVDPEGSILAQPDSLNKKGFAFYEIEGIGYDFVPEVLDRTCVDRWIKTDDKTSFQMARRIIREEGILVGGSSGANLAAALEAAKDLKEGQKCVVILPDGIRNYMTKFVTDNWMEARHYKEIKNEFNFWWWDRKVHELELSIPIITTTKTPCIEALIMMQNNKVSQLPVIGDKGELTGVLSMEMLTKRVINKNFQLNEIVEKAMTKKYYKVTNNDSLGFCSRVLETEEFIVVIDDEHHCIGIITHCDLFGFILKRNEGDTEETYLN